MALRFSPARGASVLVSSSSRGPTGAAASLTIGTTTTLAEGSSATVANSGTSSAAILNFGVPRGVTPTIGFNFSTTTIDSDPGSGNVRFNNATIGSVTTIYFDNVDRDGNTVTGWLDSFDDSTTTGKGTLIITPPATPSNKLIYAVSGSVVDGTGYRKVTVSWVSGTVLPTNAAHLAFQFSRTGDRGADVTGIKQTYSTTTSDADPGNGTFRLNNATPASATAAYLDNLDAGGATVSGVFDLWDDSTNTVRGSVTFEKSTDSTVWARFQITGSVVDGTGYRKLTLANGSGSGAFTNGDTFAITFARAGDKGADGTVAGPGVSVDSEVALWSGTGGAALKRATGSGIPLLTSGVQSISNVPNYAETTAAQYQANTASKLLTTDKVWSAAAPVALTDASTVTPDFSTGFDFTWTIGATGRTLANPSNPKAGQKGVIYLIQDATGSRTITTWGTQYKFPGGVKPTLTTTAGAIDLISYFCKSTTEVECFFAPNMS